MFLKTQCCGKLPKYAKLEVVINESRTSGQDVKVG